MKLVYTCVPAQDCMKKSFDFPFSERQFSGDKLSKSDVSLTALRIEGKLMQETTNALHVTQ